MGHALSINFVTTVVLAGLKPEKKRKEEYSDVRRRTYCDSSYIRCARGLKPMETLVFLSGYLTNSPVLKPIESIRQSVQPDLEPAPRCQEENSPQCFAHSCVFRKLFQMQDCQSQANLVMVIPLVLFVTYRPRTFGTSMSYRRAEKASFLRADPLDGYQLLQVQVFNHSYQRTQEKLNKSWI